MAREIRLSDISAEIVSSGKFCDGEKWAHSRNRRQDFRLTIPMGEL